MSHGELILCDVPMLPPSLSLPCFPLPATVMTVPFSRLILGNRKKCIYIYYNNFYVKTIQNTALVKCKLIHEIVSFLGALLKTY